MVKISAETPDWSRETPRRFWDPGRKLLKSLRDYQKLQARKNVFSAFGKKVAVARHWFWSIATQCDIPLNTEIGGGLLMPHPNGIVVHPRSRIGPNCLLMQQTTLGSSGSSDKGFPVIGGHVDISAGARILGGVTIADHALIAANAVVTKNVGRAEIVGGVPARAIGVRDEYAEESQA